VLINRPEWFFPQTRFGMVSNGSIASKWQELAHILGISMGIAQTPSPFGGCTCLVVRINTTESCLQLWVKFAV
jgi:hypothetical protein